MRRNTFSKTLLALAAAALLPLAGHAQAIKMTLGHGAAVGNPRHEASVKFAELVKAKTGGRIEVQVAPSAQLGDDAAMVTALRTGALDFSANSQGAVANAVPEYAAFGMPFMSSTLVIGRLLLVIWRMPLSQVPSRIIPFSAVLSASSLPSGPSSSLNASAGLENMNGMP